MNSKEVVLKSMRAQGRTDALDLRSRSGEMDGTSIIAEEQKVPVFDPQKDYTDWPVGSPVRELVGDEYQVFSLFQPHNASHYKGTPSTLQALWSLCHTKDPAKAKPYMAPLGTSGLYMKDECCTDPMMPDPTQVYRSLVDNGAYAPSEYFANWEAVIMEGDLIDV